MKRFKLSNLGTVYLALIGAAICLLSVAASSLALAIVCSLLKNPTSLTGGAALLSLALGALVSGIVISRIADGRELTVSVISALTAAVVMVGAGLIWGHGRIEPGTLVCYLAFTAITVLSSLLARPRAKKRKYR